MNSLVLILGVTLLALCEARPTVHKVTSKLITHVYKFREKVTGPDGRPKDRRDKNGLGLKTNCQDGALVGVDRGLERGISGITNNAEGVISDVTLHGNLLGVAGDAVDHVGHAAQGLIDNVDHGLGNGIDDLACGIGKDADEIAEGVQTGDILGGLADVAGTTVTSVADTLGALADGAVGGVDDVLDQALDILKSLVGRGLERGISGIINNAAGVVSDVTAHGNLLGIVGGAVDHVGHAAQGLVDNVDHGLGNGIQALACGVGKIADEVASAVQTGDLLGGAADVVGTAVTSVASTLGDVVGGAVGGVASVISQAVGIIADL